MVFALIFLIITASCFAKTKPTKQEPEKKSFSYRKLLINDRELEFNDLQIAYDILTCNFTKLIITNYDKLAKKFHIENIMLEFNQREKYLCNWQIYFAFYSKTDASHSLSNLRITNKSGATLCIESLLFTDFENIRVQNLTLTPSNEFFAWKLCCQELIADSKQIITKNNKIGIAKLELPIMNWHRKHTPSSGFLIPNFKKDEFDDFLIQLPYYFYFDELTDLTLTPNFGKSAGFHFELRQILDHSIAHVQSDSKYLASESFERGIVVNTHNSVLHDNNCLLFDITCASSTKYLKYYNAKYLNSSRKNVPWHIYYYNENMRIGFRGFHGIDASDIIVPKFRLQKTWNVNDVAIRSAASAVGIMRIESDKIESDKLTSSYPNYDDKNDRRENWRFETLIAASPKILAIKNITNNIECGTRYIGSDKNQIIKPFFVHDVQLGRFHDASANSFITLAPYIKYKLTRHFYLKNELVANAEDEEYAFQDLSNNKIGSSLRITRNFTEAIETANIGNAVQFGSKIYFPNTALDLGILKDKHGSFAAIGAQYRYANVYLGSKKYIHLQEKTHNNITSTVGINANSLDLRFDYIEVQYNAKKYSKIIQSCSVPIQQNCLIRLHSVFTLQPVSELARGGAELIYQFNAWKLSFGCSYGIDPLKNIDKKNVKFTFAISINGFDQFIHLYQHLQKIDLDKFAINKFQNLGAN